MKRLLSLTLALLLAVFSGCNAAKGAGEYAFQATIMELNGDFVLAMPLEGEDIRRSSDLVSFSKKDLEELGAAEGDTVSVIYNGEVMESYPAQVVALGWSLLEKTEMEIPAESAAPAAQIEKAEAEYRYQNVYMKVALPEGWAYSVRTYEDGERDLANEDAGSINFGISFWPQDASALRFEILYNQQGNAICGTGVTANGVELASGLKGTAYTEEIEDELSLYLFFDGHSKYFLTCSAPQKLWSAYEGDIAAIFDTIEIGGEFA